MPEGQPACRRAREPLRPLCGGQAWGSGARWRPTADRGGGLIYDTTRNITWLADMNYAQTSGHTGTGVNANGRMTWDAATAWANNLVYGGFDDWRLPTLNPADTTCSSNLNPGGGFPNQYFGTGCTGGELSGLFVTDLGNKAGESVLNQVGDTAQQIANLVLFSNVQSFVYWSVRGTRRILAARGTSVPAMATRTASARTLRCMPWLCAPAM